VLNALARFRLSASDTLRLNMVFLTGLRKLPGLTVIESQKVGRVFLNHIIFWGKRKVSFPLSLQGLL
jgi:hypothetical protein